MIDIASVLTMKEQVTIEAKSARNGIPNSIWETYSSFSNTFGGTILLGVDEDKNTRELIPCGVANSSQMISDIWNTLNNPQKVSANLLLEHHLYSIRYHDMDLVVIEVPQADRRDRPVYVGQDMFRGTFRRNHEGDYHCSREQVKSMLRDQADTTSDALLLENVDPQSLNQESIRRYRILFNGKKPDHVWSKLSTDEFLIKIGAARKSQLDGKVHPTLGGLIFFGDFMEIVNELPYYFLDYREHMVEGMRWSDRVSSGDSDWSGNLFDFYFRIIDRLTSDVKTPFALQDGLTRIDETPIHSTLREALANCLIHADFYGTRGIVIDKSFRKITFSNPGLFRIGIDEAIAGGISDARNSRIFNMFSLIQVGERSGTGLCNLYHVWESSGFKRPELIETTNPDRSTLTLQFDRGGSPPYSYHLGGHFTPSVRETGIANDAAYKSGVVNDAVDVVNDAADVVSNAVDVVSGAVNDNERKVLAYLGQFPHCKIADICAATALGKSTVDRCLRSLKDKGKLTRRGSDKSVHWIVL